jgi:DNA-binding LacI/PurR family transcriptional regulator
MTSVRGVAGRRPVIADVAREAGVSPMTVSRVLNAFPGVADATRGRVEEAVERLGYRANHAARVLAGGRSRTLGVVAVETDQFGPSRMLFGVESAARVAGHQVSFVTMRPGDGLAVTIEHLRASHVDGVVVLAPVSHVVEAVTGLEGDLPLVVVGAEPSSSASTVRIDQEAGARLATRHLLDLGHATVHHVSGARGWVDAASRRRGWAAELRAAGARRPPPLPGDWTARGGYEAGRELAQDRAVTAIFAANDQTALGVLRALAEQGRRVPEDVSVVGFDDLPESEFFLPPLTTVRQDFAEVGRRAVEVVLGSEEQHVLVQPELTVRASG